MLPMLQIFDRSNGELVTSIFNFIDIIGAQTELTVDGIEKFLMTRGILQPNLKLQGKDADTYMFTNQSSWLNRAYHDKLDADCKNVNEILESNTEKRHDIEFDSLWD